MATTTKSQVRFKERFDVVDVRRLAAGYKNPEADDTVIAIGARARDRGFYTRDELLEVGRWKSARVGKRQSLNSDDYVREVTGIALSTSCERLRIEVLTLLEGVGWPTASVLMHLGHRDPYPVLDFRAVWSVGYNALHPHTFEFWNAYTEYCRELAQEAGVSMRTLDRALWAYSKAKQKA